MPAKVMNRIQHLSQGEYLALAVPLSRFWKENEHMFPPPPSAAVGMVEPTAALVQCLLQAEICPKLLDYTGRRK